MKPDSTVVVIPNFISENERGQLEKLALNYMETGVFQANENGDHRFFKCVVGAGDGNEYCDLIIQQLGSRVIETFGLEDFPIDPYLGWIVSLIEPGGYVHAHTDNFEHYQNTTDKHLRCNVLITMENETYKPIINELRIPVEPSSLWGFFPSDIEHGTQLITGNSPRINYQFGFTVPEDYELKVRGS